MLFNAALAPLNGRLVSVGVMDYGPQGATVRETSFEQDRDVQPRPKLGRWPSDLDELMDGNAAKSARVQLTLIHIFEEIRRRG